MKKLTVSVMVAATAALLSACGGSQEQQALEIVGSYSDDWGTTHTITESSWTQHSEGMDDSVFEIAAYDNDADFLVAQGAAGNPFNPGKWSRFDWTFDEDGNLFYCQIAYAASSESEAASSNSANHSDLSAGCAGFGWSGLSERLEIIGIWEDTWGFEQKVSQAEWTSGDSVFHTSQFDNHDDFLIAQNDTNNQWSPDKWSRFDWTWDESGKLYFCQSAFDAESEQDALSATSADREDLESGCGGFSWSALEIRPAITGNWVDDWGYSQVVTKDTWTSDDSVFHITGIHNRAGYLVAHNDPDNQWAPDLWSRFDWTESAGALYFCQIVFDAETQEAATANTGADRSDLEAGCNGFGWSKLNPQ